MEGAALVPGRLLIELRGGELAGAELSEVFTCFGAVLDEELQLDPAKGVATGFGFVLLPAAEHNVQEYHRVSSVDGLHNGRVGTLLQ